MSAGHDLPKARSETRHPGFGFAVFAPRLSRSLERYARPRPLPAAFVVGAVSRVLERKVGGELRRNVDRRWNGQW